MLHFKVTHFNAHIFALLCRSQWIQMQYSYIGTIQLVFIIEKWDAIHSKSRSFSSYLNPNEKIIFWFCLNDEEEEEKEKRNSQMAYGHMVNHCIYLYILSVRYNKRIWWASLFFACVFSFSVTFLVLWNPLSYKLPYLFSQWPIVTA